MAPQTSTGDSSSNGHDTAHSNFAIVGVGASAGGLAALKTFFQYVPKDSGLAFVVVVHLSADHESHLPDILQSGVRIPVNQVVDSVSIEPDNVYVIPPGRNLEAVDSHLRLSSLEEARRDRAPIDHFLRTLAKTYDGVSIGVILSGTGSDGTLGIRDIKQVGGLTVVQDPNEAEYDGMPQSAIATGMVDLTLPVAEIPQAILRYVRTEPDVPVPNEGEDLEGVERQQVQQLFAQIRGRTGRDFSRYKRSTIMRRIARRMQLHQIERLEQYVEMVRSQAEEARALADDFLVTVTSFFRDPDVFQALEQQVIPRLFEDKQPEDTVRVWSVGCATGEEAYTLAMLLVEELGRRDRPQRIQVFASDLHERSLRSAREGLYPSNIEADVSPERLDRFFVKQSGGYRVRQEIRELVVFAPHNLLADPPFSRLDLISCRNLLIYLEREVQRDVIELFHYALRPDGYLLLGTSETAGRSDLFRVVSKPHCVYRKRNVPTREPRLPVFSVGRGGAVAGPIAPAPDTPASFAAFHAQLIERHAAPSVLIDQSHNVVHLSNDVGRYMRLPGGDPTSSVFKLLRDELRLELRAGLHAAEEARRPTRTEPIVLELDGEPREVIMQIWPGDDLHEGLSLVVFEERSEPCGPEATGEASDRDLRAELDLTKERLQGLIEKYETGQEEMSAANEELQSANEELRSTMEELETSKEELQSINEELATLNQENRHKVEELSQLSSDLQNLMAATDIATLFLDRDLRILRFTPKVGELFNIRPSDRGRPLTDLTHRLGYAELTGDAERTLDKLAPIEREVQDSSGRWYLARVLPYRTASDQVGGVVLTFVEITARIQNEAALRQQAEADAFRLALTDAIRPLVDPLEVQAAAARALGERFAASRVFYVELQPDTDGSEPRLRGEVRTGYSRQVPAVLGEYTFAEHGAPLLDDLRAGRTVVVTDVEADPRISERERDRARTLEVQAFVSVPVIKTKQPVGVFVVQQRSARTWTPRELALMEETVERMWTTAERVQAAAAQRASEDRYQTLFEAIDEGFCMIEVLFDERGVAVDYRFTEVNPAFEKQTGIVNAVGRRMREILPSQEEHWFEIYGRVIQTGESIRFEAPAAGLDRYFDVYAVRVGQPGNYRLAVVFRDIGERRRLEERLRNAADELAESNRRKDEFLATLAHELRNPLAPIVNALAILRHPETEVPVARLHAIIERQVRHMVRLVDDLLDVSRITRGVVELRRQPVELGEVVRSAIETSKPLIDGGKKQLIVTTPDVPLVVDGDPARLVQIVANLLNNAAKYTEVGGTIWITLAREDAATARASEPEPSGEPETSRERARIEVRDDGVGIPADMLANVFDMFTQVNRARTDGLGVGLTLVRSLVALHNGTVGVRSDGVGHGSEFVVRLPLRQASEEAFKAAESGRAPILAERACPTLVVDDNRDAADSLALLLATFGVEVRIAYDGPTALEQVLEWSPELVFLDLGMPDMDGYEVARAIRRTPQGDGIRLVAVTGWGQHEYRERTREAGFDRHLVKPVDADALAELMAEIL